MKTILFLPILALLSAVSPSIMPAAEKAGSATAAPAAVASKDGDKAAAEALLKEILKPGADAKALTAKLRPTKEDYAAVFADAAFAAKAEAAYAPAWDGGAFVLSPKPGQTELLLSSATTEDLKAWNEKAKEFPGGYKDAAGKFKDGLTIYRFKFVKPGETLGMAFDGLVHVNGHWCVIPKPWKIN